jgi:hypothetical protein
MPSRLSARARSPSRAAAASGRSLGEPPRRCGRAGSAGTFAAWRRLWVKHTPPSVWLMRHCLSTPPPCLRVAAHVASVHRCVFVCCAVPPWRSPQTAQATRLRPPPPPDPITATKTPGLQCEKVWGRTDGGRQLPSTACCRRYGRAPDARAARAAGRVRAIAYRADVPRSTLSRCHPRCASVRAPPGATEGSSYPPPTSINSRRDMDTQG